MTATSEPGWEKLVSSPFLALIGPISVRWEPGPVFRVVVSEPGTNTLGSVHGGYLAGVIDIVVGQAVKRLVPDRRVVTMSTTIDYLGPAAVGEAIDIDVVADAITRSAVFASCRLHVGDRPVARASMVLATRDKI